MSARVWIIVLTWNQRDTTLECLHSLATVEYPNHQIVVVDNGSSDGTVAAIHDQCPAVTVLVNPTNLGYAEGNNVGLRYALAQNADYALILNNDTSVAPDFLTRLVEIAERNPQAAFFGPLVLHHSEPHVIQSAGGLMTADWRFYHRGQNEEEHGQYREPEEVVWVSGCAILARCTALAEIGLLDARFFMYGEELDWCLRGREAGYRVMIVPAAKIWHKGVQRDYRPAPRITYLSARNELLLLRKHRAGRVAAARAWLRHLRTLASWSIRPRWRDKRDHRDALARALYDYARGRFGAPSGIRDRSATRLYSATRPYDIPLS